jgi:hypothetical protein
MPLPNGRASACPPSRSGKKPPVAKRFPLPLGQRAAQQRRQSRRRLQCQAPKSKRWKDRRLQPLGSHQPHHAGCQPLWCVRHGRQCQRMDQQVRPRMANGPRILISSTSKCRRARRPLRFEKQRPPAHRPPLSRIRKRGYTRPGISHRLQHRSSCQTETLNRYEPHPFAVDLSACSPPPPMRSTSPISRCQKDQYLTGEPVVADHHDHQPLRRRCDRRRSWRA